MILKHLKIHYTGLVINSKTLRRITPDLESTQMLYNTFNWIGNQLKHFKIHRVVLVINWKTLERIKPDLQSTQTL